MPGLLRGHGCSGTIGGSAFARPPPRPRVATVTGKGPIGYIAQNGIEIASGASALVKGNTVTRNWYTDPSVTACGLLFFQAGGVKQQANSLSANQTNLCNAGRGGGNAKP